MTTQPSDWAVARAYWEVVMNGTGGLQGPYLIGRIELRARELDASGGGPKPIAEVMGHRDGGSVLWTDQRVPIGTKLYATPRAAEAGDLSKLYALADRWEALALKFAAMGSDIAMAEAASMRNNAKELRAAMAAVAVGARDQTP